MHDVSAKKSMQKNLIAIGVGIITSVVGGYTYAYLLSINFPFIYALGGLLLLVAASTFAYLNRGKAYLIFRSGIKGYYHKGQADYIARAAKAVRKSKEVIVVGARGSDLTGESSPIGKALKASSENQKVEIFLLDPLCEHSRLRSDHLDVERRKYIAESEGVDGFFGVLKLHKGRPITKYSYNEKPLFRMIITDSSIFLSFYHSGVRGKDLPCWHISRTSNVLDPKIESYVAHLREISDVRNYGTEGTPVQNAGAITVTELDES
jgi:hypothetical protein